MDKASLTYDHPTVLTEDFLLKCCKTERGRGGGPGGQHRNKVETAVCVIHTQSGVSGSASERRSQGENKRVAIMRLRLNLALVVRSNAAACPSDLWKSRVKKGKILCNAKHWDYPTMLAESLDVVADNGFDIGKAGQILGCSGSQLVKLIKVERKAMVLVNDEREKLGLGKLK